MALNIGHNAPFGNMWGWRGIKEKEELNSMKAYDK
jgi:hypothetical protein